MKKFLTAILTTLLLAQPAQALPVHQAVQTALTNNPNLQRTEQSIRVAEESLKSARGRRGVTVSASGRANISKTEGVEESESVSTGLSASVPLYSGKRLETAIKSAQLDIDISKLEFSQAQDDLIYQVVTAYVNALENLATSRVDLETEKNLAEHEKMIAAHYDAGAKAKIDLLRAQVETSNALQTAARSHATYEVALTNLAALMSVDSIVNLTVEDFETHLTLGDVEKYLAEADDNRHDLQADALRIEQGELNVTSAKSGWLPEVSASVGTDLSGMSRRWHFTPDASAGVSASWNIFDSGVTRAAVEAAKVEVERLKLAMDANLDGVHEDVITAHKNLRIALLRLTTTQRAVELAEEERYIATERYNAGEGILLDILDAEVALSTAKKNNVSARYDVMRYSFDLAHAAGNTLRALGEF
ncbi:MAG: TolC family protein [Selenomonadaceae bacterium]|nr:TolC family protein [Selenomonadaceae bacterium]MBQ6132288.1 TolC family protein [Selenomonadaceae bacterium]MBQ7493692.1 TolC family protein [Selenomonadaceae bacterium]